MALILSIVFISCVSPSNAKNSDQGVIRQRHIVDSAQIIDFIDLNDNTTSDLGSGGGIPGLIIAILMKHFKSGI